MTKLAAGPARAIRSSPSGSLACSCSWATPPSSHSVMLSTAHAVVASDRRVGQLVGEDRGQEHTSQQDRHDPVRRRRIAGRRRRQLGRGQHRREQRQHQERAPVRPHRHARDPAQPHRCPHGPMVVHDASRRQGRRSCSQEAGGMHRWNTVQLPVGWCRRGLEDRLRDARRHGVVRTSRCDERPARTFTLTRETPRDPGRMACHDQRR